MDTLMFHPCLLRLNPYPSVAGNIACIWFRPESLFGKFPWPEKTSSSRLCPSHRTICSHYLTDVETQRPSPYSSFWNSSQGPTPDHQLNPQLQPVCGSGFSCGQLYFLHFNIGIAVKISSQWGFCIHLCIRMKGNYSVVDNISVTYIDLAIF